MHEFLPEQSGFCEQPTAAPVTVSENAGVCEQIGALLTFLEYLGLREKIGAPDCVNLLTYVIENAQKVKRRQPILFQI